MTGTQAQGQAVSVCPDCALWLVNRDDSGAAPGWREAFDLGVQGWEGGTFTGPDGGSYFGTSPCDVCGDGYHGDRLDMTWTPEQ